MLIPTRIVFQFSYQKEKVAKSYILPDMGSYYSIARNIHVFWHDVETRGLDNRIL